MKNKVILTSWSEKTSADISDKMCKKGLRKSKLYEVRKQITHKSWQRTFLAEGSKETDQELE
jgi:hypothetical protein